MRIFKFPAKGGILRQGGGVLLLRVLGFGLGWLTTFLVARSLGAEELGKINISLFFVMLVSAVLRVGLDNALTRRSAELLSQNLSPFPLFKRVLSVFSSLSLFASALIFILSPQISSHIFKKDFLEGYIRISSVAVFLLSVSSLCAFYLRGVGKVVLFGAVQFFLPNAFRFSAVFLLLVVLRIENSLYVVGAYMLSFFAVFLIALSLSFSERFEKKGEGKSDLAGLLKIAVPLWGPTIFGILVSHGLVLILGAVSSPAEVGLWVVAKRFFDFLAFVFDSFASAFAPLAVRTNDKKMLVRLYIRVIIYSTVFSLPFVILLLLFPQEFMGIFGEEFRRGDLALRVLTLGFVIHCLTGPTFLFLGMKGWERTVAVASFLFTVFELVLAFWFASRLGALGVAVAHTTTLFLLKTAGVILVLKFFRSV